MSSMRSVIIIVMYYTLIKRVPVKVKHILSQQKCYEHTETHHVQDQSLVVRPFRTLIHDQVRRAKQFGLKAMGFFKKKLMTKLDMGEVQHKTNSQHKHTHRE